MSTSTYHIQDFIAAVPLVQHENRGRLREISTGDSSQRKKKVKYLERESEKAKGKGDQRGRKICKMLFHLISNWLVCLLRDF